MRCAPGASNSSSAVELVEKSYFLMFRCSLLRCGCLSSSEFGFVYRGFRPLTPPFILPTWGGLKPNPRSPQIHYSSMVVEYVFEVQINQKNNTNKKTRPTYKTTTNMVRTKWFAQKSVAQTISHKMFRTTFSSNFSRPRKFHSS